MNQSGRLLIFCLVIAALASTTWAVIQSFRLQSVQQDMAELQRLHDANSRQIDQCEANMRSAAVQLSNLSNIVQEATAAAAECLLADAL